MRIKRKLLVNIAVLFVSIVVCILLGAGILELYLRLTYHADEPMAIEYSANVGWENKKNFHATFYSPQYHHDVTVIHNSQGFRDTREFGPDKTKPRIVVIGDSFVYGWLLDQNDTLGYQLQRLLPDYEVIAVGTDGYSTTQYLQIYEARVRQLHPDVVVFGKYVNDFGENNYFGIMGFTKPWIYAITPNGTPIRQQYPTNPAAVAPVGEEPKFHLPVFYAKVKENIKGKFGKLLYSKTAWRDNYGWAMFEKQDSPMQQYYASIEYIALMDATARMKEDNVTFVVVYTPVRWQVDAKNKAAVFGQWSDIDVKNFDDFRPNRYYDEFQRRLGFYYLDLTPYVAALKDPSDAYILVDGHMSPTGIGIYAGTLARYLKEKGIINATSS